MPGANPDAPGSAAWPGGVPLVLLSCISWPGEKLDAPWSPATGPPDVCISWPGELVDVPRLWDLLPANAEVAIANPNTTPAVQTAILNVLMS
ncbi:hypothetical protein HYPDE_38203 [Hyphomicrobium denitrificans 1NES1]|uniref:Uncharacterized protein n=1 Tax=Hyphomicrobium denitrificans 1NES1 TaxID=670307 RepID=N0BAM6_9HYPH|nr:hypothetical protein HYPDE_38203 [Hyphomicrobium denitrificans 1NES1]